MWQHFESFHIIHEPSYTAKYPPLQSLTLAVGQWLGHPIIGVCLASGVSIAALVWMLYGWLPKEIRWLAWLIAVTHPSFHFFFAHSYMGGAVAITGASLLLGAFPRLDEKLKPSLAVAAGIGILLLANSRPFEGLFLTAAVAIGLGFRMMQQQWNRIQFAKQIVAPTTITLFIGAVGMLGYNHQVTGDMLTMPYQVHEQSYGWNPIFIWQVAGEKPDYRHEAMERFFKADKEVTELEYASSQLILSKKLMVAVGLLSFYCGPCILMIFGIWWYRHQQLTPYLIGFLIPVFLASIISKWANFHYAAPAAPLLLALMIASSYGLWNCFKVPAVKRGIIYTAIAFHCIWFMNVITDTGSLHRGNWGVMREEVAAQLKGVAGKDLVFVRYTDDHNVHQEWVYNRANIDESEVVWAREINDQRRQELIDYFPERQVWILTANQRGYDLEPFSTISSPHMSRSTTHEAY